MLTACVTGHRRLRDPEQVRHVLAAALDRALAEGYTVWYVGMALGADQMAVELMLGKAHRVVAVIPCDDYDRPWPASLRRRYRSLLARADEVVVYPGGPYAPWKPHARNRWMVDRSQLVVAVWDGRCTGGTYGTVEHARARGVPVRVVWPGKRS